MISSLLGIIKDFQSALGYFNINQKVLNRIYLAITALPLGYLIYIVAGLFINNHIATGILWLLIWILLMYFWTINFLYYVFDRNTKADITQWLPEKVLDQAALKSQKDANDKPATGKDQSDLSDIGIPINIPLTNETRVKLVEMMSAMIGRGEIKTQSTGYVIPRNTLYPDYYTDYVGDNQYQIFLGSNNRADGYLDAGKITVPASHHGSQRGEIIGIYISGGDEIKNGIRLRHRYVLTALVRK